MQCIVKYCIRWVSCLIGLMALPCASAQTVHIAHCLAGCPEGAPAPNEIVVRQLFAASINYQSGLADWVAYRVLPGSVGVASLLPREWLPEELLTQQSAQEVAAEPRFMQPDISNLQDRDYRITEVIINPEDRGRLAPMSSFAGTPYWDDLNYLSNMAPLPAALRLGPWSRLDQAINELASRIGDVFVVSGPLPMGADLDSGATARNGIPAAFYKFVATASANAVFIFPSTSAVHSSFCDREASLDRLQELSGLDFLPGVGQTGNESLYGLLGCNANMQKE